MNLVKFTLDKANSQAYSSEQTTTEVSNMTIENGVRVLAGSMVLLSVILTWFVHPNFLWLTVFVGVNLIQSAFTGFCPAAFFLKKLGLR
ncbi:conserved hypothetical protein [Vibrio cholerae MAK 757]|uniref:Inner membrane protein YgaP-like transmembrane domain-containing protein n=9 Tax=Vibrio TaxID=662 RepID=Q9KLU8_VIBCH|nr:conserved hypothetical protein [Vibrio cholerae O1 biovar El Tor str. N16961]ACP07563.1 conserved hypothetical protein [Vibrio cholerae M66-2]ACQ62639.1 rhodanese-related sulfurtransferase [Vibrio cholerae MJ-1236]AET28748.1 conserved hypothetical protein [Vibrio cholerae O1 str. 2010EL-1786]EAZ72434.1 conserved hypothetical protein [Vibrio cholerae NCTC 8457]EEO08068.1 rhodanese-related sulfurtransferase [Vibrio cholerae TM 11079-80]EEO11341.1 rhodanese-related sulfurtransferase [Vibrio c